MTFRCLLPIVLVVMMAALLGPPNLSAQQLPGGIFDRTDFLSKVGVDRTSQALALLESVSWMTIGDFAVHPRIFGALSSDPLLLVDGMAVDGPLFGMVNVNAVPLQVRSWDSITVSHAPRVHAGAFRAEPVISIVPSRPKKSVRATAGGWVANSIGDPGPYQYLDSTLTNVERIGPGGHATVSYGAESWFVETHFLTRRHGLQSPNVSPRLNGVYQGPHQTPRMRTASISLRTGIEVEQSRFRATVYRTLVDDFLFLEGVGHEIPTDVNSTGVQVRGTTDVSTDITFAFGGSHSSTATDRRPGSLLDWELDWSESHHNLFAEAEFGRAAVGTALNIYSGASPSMGGWKSIYLSAFYASVQLLSSDAVSQTAGVHVTFGRAIAPAFWSLTSLRPSKGVHFSVSASAGHRLSADRPSLWYWHSEGYDLLDRAGVFVEHLDPSVRSRFAAADISGALYVGSRTTLSARTFGSVADDLSLPDIHYRVHPITNDLSGSVSVDGDASGSLWGGTFSLESQPHEHLLQRVGYTYVVPLGSLTYRRTMDNQPQHRLVGIVLFEPNDRFSLGGVVRLESATRWRAYAEAADVGSRYVDQLPARFRIDLSAFKRLWGPRLDAGLTVRNVLNRKLRYHPLGVNHPTTLAVRLVLRTGEP